jgi:hypothetical protein
MKTGFILIVSAALFVAGSARGQRGTERLQFEVSVVPGLLQAPRDGRLIVVLGRAEKPEPRFSIGSTGMDAPPILGRDVRNFFPGVIATVDETAAIFPLESLWKLPARDYFVQAVFIHNEDLRLHDAPGNLYSPAKKVHLDPARGGRIQLELTAKIPPERLPPETEYIKYVKIQSQLLSQFHGRPIYLRAGIILPKGYNNEPERRYPLRVRIGGYGTRYTVVERLMAEGSEFRRAWFSDQAPHMILLQLDGAGPYGDPYQINSANNGPYGDAIVKELIPYVERRFRAIGEPGARVLEGGSTGGWVALALQIFYPDFFNGVWSYCPDSVDFRAFQLVNIYEDKNAYINRNGFERPAARQLNGDVRYTMRHECQMENVLGRGDSWAMSGGQWGAWNAAYGPRGDDGRPVPLWDPKTGEINQRAIEHWKKYDLRLILERNWKELGPKLRGKLRIWVGEADNYFLNNAVHLLEEFLRRADPPYDGKIVYGPGEGHCWRGLTELEVSREMAAAIERSK